MKLQKLKNGRGGYVSITEVVAILIFLGLVLSIWWGASYHERVEMHESYRAWVKQTDNPKDLTYEEWRALIRSDKQHSQVILIPIPQ